MAKQVTVVELGGFGGVVVNPSAKDKGTSWEVPYAEALKAATSTGIDTYVSRLKAGKRIKMRANNKVFAPALRTFKNAESGNSSQNEGGSIPTPPVAVAGTARRPRTRSDLGKMRKDELIAAILDGSI
jgi:hypothetical protein